MRLELGYPSNERNMIPSILAWTPSENVKPCSSSFNVLSTPVRELLAPNKISGSEGLDRDISTTVTWHNSVKITIFCNCTFLIQHSYWLNKRDHKLTWSSWGILAFNFAMAMARERPPIASTKPRDAASLPVQTLPCATSSILST